MKSSVRTATGQLQPYKAQVGVVDALPGAFAGNGQPTTVLKLCVGPEQVLAYSLLPQVTVPEAP